MGLPGPPGTKGNCGPPGVCGVKGDRGDPGKLEPQIIDLTIFRPSYNKSLYLAVNL